MGDEFEKYSKKTKYDVPKQTKAENFKYLNERYPAQNCRNNGHRPRLHAGASGKYADAD